MHRIRALLPSSRRGRLVVAVAALCCAVIVGAGGYAIARGFWLAILLGLACGFLVLVLVRVEVQSRRIMQVPHEQIRTFDGFERRLAKVEAAAVQTELAALDMQEGVADIRGRTATSADLVSHYNQTQAAMNLFAMLGGVDRVPPMRGWAASPDIILELVAIVRRDKPALVVECGSGLSTLWMALAAARSSPETRIVSLEHSPDFARQTKALLEAHGVGDRVEVRVAPLENWSDFGQPWYARDAVADLDGIGLLFVDGPPQTVEYLARRPALLALEERMTADGIVVLDDMIRGEEQATVREWRTRFPEFAEEILHVEKGASILRRGSK